MKTINNQGDVALNHLEYNEIGQLAKKNMHNDTQATTFAYNERGWMKNSNSDQFSMELKYNDGSLPQFNGNISSQNYTNGMANAFTYSYDKLNRLTNATAGDNMDETISYDVMGNITSLARGNLGTNNYTGYNGNRLTSISGFTNSSYAYDANGNLTSDSQKNITLGYNFLNLPQTVTGSQNLIYIYNAAGEKLQKQAGGTTTNYIDGIQYTNNSIDFIQTEEGLARRSGNNYSYEYNLSDHLGNVRVTFYQNPTTNQLEVLQRDDYYAFGLRKVATGGTNKYLYNGKELQEELGQYDYGARFYDPVIGRWNAIDPMSETSRRFSPYVYGNNNPIRFIDPDGMQTTDANGNVSSDNAEEAQAMFRQIQSQYSSSNQEQDPPNKKKQDPFDSETLVKKAPRINKVTSWYGRLWYSLNGGRDYEGINYDNDGNPVHVSYIKFEINPPFGSKGSLSLLSQLSVEEKLAGYLLNAEHAVGASKAKWFQQALGYTQANSAGLAKQLVFDSGKAVQTAVTQYGTKFNQVIKVTGANGRTIEVMTAWIKNNDNVVRLITAFPVK